MERCEDSNPQPFFGEDSIISPEKSDLEFFKRMKSAVCKLNFDAEPQHSRHGSNIPMEINKVSALKCFSSPPKSRREETEGNKSQFYQLKSSPMQMFNSFSSNFSPFLTQAIPQKGGLIVSEGKVINKNICCNCKKSHCLKLYCECFANKRYCQGCNCANCFNIKENDDLRTRAMQTTLDRNPIAFDPKITTASPSVN